MDEMYKQCIFAKKTEEVNVTASVTFVLFERLFAKPLLLLGMENALALLEERRDFDGKSGGNGMQFWPEMDKTSLGQTMTVIGFHRKYMKHVFTNDELDQYQKFRAEARKMNKQQQFFLEVPTVGMDGHIKSQDPLKMLEEYRVSREGLVELKPFGIDNKEVI